MKILLLTPQLPYPPHQGTTIRNFNLLKLLAQHHQLDLLSFGERAELDQSSLNDLCGRIEIEKMPVRSLVRRAVETVSSLQPDMARRLYSPALAARLSQMLDETRYDVIQIEGIEMAGIWLAAGKAGRVPVTVFDEHNCEYVLQRTAYEIDRDQPRRWHAALYSLIQWKKLRRFERAACLAADHVVAVSQDDARSLQALDPHIRPSVIPNGVDVEYYVPSDEVCAKPLAELSIVFTGKLDFRPNIDAALWFSLDILPLIRQSIPLAHFVLVGQKPSAKEQALAARPGIEVTGRVPDTRPYIADAAVYVVPVRMGGGTRLKVLEAMAMGKAIVSTTRGVEGIGCRDGRDVVLADSPAEFAAAVVALLRDRARARELGQAARRLAEQEYDWRKLVPRFEALYVKGDGGR